MTALCPGPVETAFIERSGMENTRVSQGFVQRPEDVAAHGVAGMLRNKPRVVPGLPLQMAVALLEMIWVPRFLKRKVVHWFHSDVD